MRTWACWITCVELYILTHPTLYKSHPRAIRGGFVALNGLTGRESALAGPRASFQAASSMPARDKRRAISSRSSSSVLTAGRGVQASYQAGCWLQVKVWRGHRVPQGRTVHRVIQQGSGTQHISRFDLTTIVAFISIDHWHIVRVAGAAIPPNGDAASLNLVAAAKSSCAFVSQACVSAL